MSKQQQTETEITRLPKEFVDRLTRPFARFLSIQAGGGVILLLFTVAALVLSNSPWAHHFENVWETSVGLNLGSFEFARSLREWINDGLMTLFFFLVALELKRELMLGELNNPRMAALSIAAALGGMIVPAAIYLALQARRAGVRSWRPTPHLSLVAWQFWDRVFRQACVSSCFRWRSLMTSAPSSSWRLAMVATFPGERLHWGCWVSL
jgi:NhaA family Na+:H+ antiporter